MTTGPSLAAPSVVVVTTYGVAGCDENVGVAAPCPQLHYLCVPISAFYRCITMKTCHSYGVYNCVYIQLYKIAFEFIIRTH